MIKSKFGQVVTTYHSPTKITTTPERNNTLPNRPLTKRILNYNAQPLVPSIPFLKLNKRISPDRKKEISLLNLWPPKPWVLPTNLQGKIPQEIDTKETEAKNIKKKMPMIIFPENLNVVKFRRIPTEPTPRKLTPLKNNYKSYIKTPQDIGPWDEY